MYVQLIKNYQVVSACFAIKLDIQLLACLGNSMIDRKALLAMAAMEPLSHN
jgi:hypothetical protein